MIYRDIIINGEETKLITFRKNNISQEICNKEYILNFINDIKQEKIKRDLITQFPPSNDIPNPNEAFKIIVGRNYDKNILEEKNNVLLTFVNRQTQCNLCKKYLEVIKTIGKKYKINNNIVFAVIDGANNEARDITFNIDDLPMIYLYTNAMKNKRVIKFIPKKPNEISVIEVEKFINDNLENSLNQNDL